MRHTCRNCGFGFALRSSLCGGNQFLETRDRFQGIFEIARSTFFSQMVHNQSQLFHIANAALRQIAGDRFKLGTGRTPFRLQIGVGTVILFLIVSGHIRITSLRLDLRNRIGQGRENACNFLRENPDIALEIETELRRRQDEKRKAGFPDEPEGGAQEAGPAPEAEAPAPAKKSRKKSAPEEAGMNIAPETGEILEENAS